MNKVKLGIVGVYRGKSMINYCSQDNRVSLTAICDIWKEGLENVRAEIKNDEIKFYDNFDEFLASADIDAVVLANYATEHAPLAIKCLNAGKHVYSEVLPVQSMAEAVKLTDAVEQSGAVYAYAENYCYMAAPREMKRIYRSGELGKFEYGEGEYFHNCEAGWADLTYGDENHWRNRMYANFYCTHSVGPLLHITGLRPVKVTGFELPYNERMARMGAKSGLAGIEMITLENGAVIKSAHGVGISKNSVWFSVYGSKGTVESGREAVRGSDGVNKVYTNLDRYDGECVERFIAYNPVDALTERANANGHGGSDFYSMYNFVSKILGEKDADIIDVYEALDMFFPGLLGYRSVLGGGVPIEIPDFKNPSAREKFRNDTACTDPAVAGKKLIPSYSKGNPDVPEAVYAALRKKCNIR